MSVSKGKVTLQYILVTIWRFDANPIISLFRSDLRSVSPLKTIERTAKCIMYVAISADFPIVLWYRNVAAAVLLRWFFSSAGLVSAQMACFVARLGREIASHRYSAPSMCVWSWLTGWLFVARAYTGDRLVIIINIKLRTVLWPFREKIMR